MEMINYSGCDIGQEEIDAVTRVMKSGWIVAGPETKAFEEEFAKYVGVKHAIFTNSCTSALKMAYKYFKENKDGNFIGNIRHIDYPRNTYCATYAAAEEMGLKTFPYGDDDIPYSVDTRVNMHYGGVKDEKPCLIEDSAHRIEPNDPLVGKIRCYSFYATKNMTTCTGGMLVTDDDEIYEKCRLYWRDGLSTSTLDRQTKGYDYEVLAMAGGYDGNDITAAIGRVQLKRLPEMNFRRQIIVNAYNEAFDMRWTGLHLYPYTKDKNLIPFLLERGIRAGFFYPPDGYVCLPLHQNLTDEDIEKVIDAVREYELRP